MIETVFNLTENIIILVVFTEWGSVQEQPSTTLTQVEEPSHGVQDAAQQGKNRPHS